MSLAEGQTFAGFTIVRLLGSGGMGDVYLAQHPRLPRQEALKVLRTDVSADPDYRARFEREADLAATLFHPHIVGVHDRGESDGQLWIAMDYVDGTDADRLIRDRYPAGMPVDEAAEIITAIASALDYAHQRGLMHRDVKPANILLSDAVGDDRRILLSDFGIARDATEISGLTTTNMTVGTVAYAAPEQLMGEQIDGRADQYALAATAYHLLTGLQLFPNSNPAVVISRHLNSPPPALADSRKELAALDRVLATALAKDPEDRFPRCSDFAQAFAEDAATGARPASTAPTTPAPIARKSAAAEAAAAIKGPWWRAGDGGSRKWMITIAALLAAVSLVGAVTLGWYVLQQRQRSSPNTPSSTTAGTLAPTPVSPSQTVLPFSGLNEPSGLAVDLAGDLYVADYNNSRVLKLSTASSTPTVVPINGINHPHGVAVDTSGALYIGDEGDKQSGRVLRVVAGSNTPTVLPFTGLYGRVQVALDTAGDLFVASGGDIKVHELAAGSSAPSALPFNQVIDPSGIVVDTVGNVYVADETPNRVWKMAAGSSGPVVLPFRGIAAPSAVAVDGAGTLYVTAQGNNQVLKLAPGSNAPTVVPFNNLNGPDSIAVDTTGNLYVGNVYSNQVVKLTANSASAPSDSGTPDTSVATTQPTSTATTPLELTPPALDDPCSDYDKLASDPSTGQEMVCGANTSPATQLFWIKAPQLSTGVHVAGTACPGAPQFVLSRSTDDYMIWCIDAARALEPGGVTLERPAGPIWALYSP